MILALVVLSIQLLIVGSTCPEGFGSQGTKCYHFSHDKEPYFMALYACGQLFGSHLAEIETPEEGTYLSQEVKTRHFDHFWIGLNDIVKEGEWRWHSTGALLSANLSNWDQNEPNNWNPVAENCVEIKIGGKWGDAECINPRPYICETMNEATIIVG